MSAHHQLCNEVQHTEHTHHKVTRASLVKKLWDAEAHKFSCKYMPAMPHAVGSQKQDQY